MFAPPPFHPARPGLVRPVRVDGAGVTGPTRKQARGPHWRRTSRGLYVPASVDPLDTRQRIVEAAAVLGHGDAVTGWAALNWIGGHWFSGVHGDGETPREVPLACHRHVRTQPGMLISQEAIRPGEVEVVDDVPVTAAVRSVCFEMRHATTLRAAVTVLDMACYSDLVSIDELAAHADALGPWTGIPQVRRAVALADENAWSPQEVAMRLLWTEVAGLPRPLCNAPVFDTKGCHLGTPDLLDPEAGVIGQYDGATHLTGEARTRDVRQEADFRDAGLECVTMLAADRYDVDHVVQRLHGAYRRAARRRESEGGTAWTAVAPRWWVPTDTVARRRGLDDRQRARLLRYRRSH